MDYLQSIGTQIVFFLRSLGFGFLLGALYDLLRFLRLVTGEKRLLLFWDVLFGVLAAFVTFLYDLVYGDGRLRLFVFAAQCAGFAVWYRFVSPAVRRWNDRVLCAVRRFCAKAAAPFVQIGSVCVQKRKTEYEKFKKYLKKLQKPQKNTCNPSD